MFLLSVIKKFIDRLETKMTDVDPSTIGQNVRPLKNNYFQSMDAITKQFIPSISSGIECSDVERRLLSLPPSEVLEYQYFQKLLTLNMQTQKLVTRFYKDIKNRITGIRHQRHNDILKNVKSRLYEYQLKLSNINKNLALHLGHHLYY